MSELGDFVSLKEFDGGQGWYAKVHADGLRFLKIFERIPFEKLEQVARFMGGQITDRKPYESVAWAIQVRPLPDLEVLLMLSLDPEFGNDFFTYYSRCALGRVPTEDTIAYTWVYMALLAWEAKRILGEPEPKYEKEEMAKAFLDERLKVFGYIDPQTAEKVAKSSEAQASKQRTPHGQSRRNLFQASKSDIS